MGKLTLASPDCAAIRASGDNTCAFPSSSAPPRSSRSAAAASSNTSCSVTRVRHRPQVALQRPLRPRQRQPPPRPRHRRRVRRRLQPLPPPRVQPPRLVRIPNRRRAAESIAAARLRLLMIVDAYTTPKRAVSTSNPVNNPSSAFERLVLASGAIATAAAVRCRGCRLRRSRRWRRASPSAPATRSG